MKHPPVINPSERRFFVYFLTSGSGELLYIGRSDKVASRLRAHVAQASSPDTMEATRKALWLMDVRHVNLVGPLSYGQAKTLERRCIEVAQPYGNLGLNPRARRLGPTGKRLRAVA